MNHRRRLAAVEGRLRSRASPTGNRSPEEEAERERQFEELYGELEMPWPPAPRDPKQVREELFSEIARCREEAIEMRENQWKAR